MFTKGGLTYREVEPVDLPLLREQRNTQWVGYRDPTSVQTAQCEKRWYDTLCADNQAFIVEDDQRKGDQKFPYTVGLLRLSGFDRLNRAVTIVGIDVFPDATGKGYATRMMRGAAEYMLHDLGFHRIVGECTAGNIAMKRAMEKAGYVLEGRKRGYIWRSGSFHDFLQYSLLAEELWPEEKQGAQGL
jgi:RimJ/RimL family protein N-acetyltransferase